jgi:hypothetical protein
MADKFSFNVTKQFTPSCLYTEPLEQPLLGTSHVCTSSTNKALSSQTTTTIHGDHHVTLDRPQPPWHAPTTPATTKRHCDTTSPATTTRQAPAGSTCRGDDVARQRYLLDVPRSLTVAMHAVHSSNDDRTTNNDGWKAREERGPLKGKQPPCPLSTDKTQPLSPTPHTNQCHVTLPPTPFRQQMLKAVGHVNGCGCHHYSSR